jgi:predicted RNA-binding Zn ribbon-like protein
MVMRKRQQAPGELERVRAFVNSRDGDDEQLTGPDALKRWLVEHELAEPDLTVAPADLQSALRLRESLRGVMLAHTEGTRAPAEAWRALDQAAARARISLRFGENGDARVEPSATGVDGALGRLLAVVHAAIAQGTWQRLKACREHTCEWAFYDHTKNRSGTWCSMEVCGNRAKARSYRERHTLAAADEAAAASATGRVD